MSRRRKPRPKRRTRRVPIPQGIKRKKEDGRPQGTYKRFPFEQTRLGFMLKYEAPVVFDLIRELSPVSRKNNPSVKLIKTVCSASNDRSFRKPKFQRYLEEYERLGVYCNRGKTLTPDREAYYERIRKVKLSKYIKKNREEVERLRLNTNCVSKSLK